MKGCELCDRAARMYCESDQASLCWECDAKVHGANFLVARHPRVLLCRSCQAQTPWRAAGARLSPTFSVCESCAAGGKASAAVEGDEWEGEAEGGGGRGEPGGSVDADSAAAGELFKRGGIFMDWEGLESDEGECGSRLPARSRLLQFPPESTSGCGGAAGQIC